MPEARSVRQRTLLQKISLCPSKLSFWINISATFLTFPASKSRVSWVQGCFSALAQTFNRFIEEVAVYRFVVLFAVACICLVLAGSAGAQTFSCPAGTEDMLNYFVMN